MIVRILGQGQFLVPDAALKLFDELDRELEEALETDDEAALRDVVPALISTVTTLGTPLPDGDFRRSQLIVPEKDSTLEELRRILAPGCLEGTATVASPEGPPRTTSRGAST